MNRPEGISESAWDKAIEATKGTMAFGSPRITEAFALAIQSSVEAEREACALIAADYFDHPSELASFIGEEIADAIRDRKGA